MTTLGSRLLMLVAVGGGAALMARSTVACSSSGPEPTGTTSQPLVWPSSTNYKVSQCTPYPCLENGDHETSVAYVSGSFPGQTPSNRGRWIVGMNTFNGSNGNYAAGAFSTNATATDIAVARPMAA